MSELRTEFALSEEQKTLINKIYDDEGLCMCGTTLAKLEDRALLALPYSHDVKDRAGIFAARAFCKPCYAVLKEALDKIRHRRKIR